MGAKSYLGEFEHMVLLAVLQLGEKAHGPDIARRLEETARREVSRGALYSSLDRLERKGYLEWRIESPPGGRGHPKRLFAVTTDGLDVLRTSRDVLLELWRGLEATLTRTAR